MFILLTAEKSRAMLRTVCTVIVDEIHAVAPNKRGAHLALSLERAAALGADRIEIYTGPWAEGHAGGRPQAALEACADTARRASVAGLGVNAGHDLSQANLGAFLEAVPAVQEVSIGHALIGEALYDGLDATVRGYLAILARTAG